MKLRLDKKELLNEVSNILSLNPINDSDSIKDINRLITLFNNKYKKDINVKVYFEKLKNGNPYYVKNSQLNKCAQLIPQLASEELKAINSNQAKKVINILYKKIFNDIEEIDYEDRIYKIQTVFSYFKLDNLFNNFITNNIFILNFRGGNRNTLPYECELDILLKVYKDISEEESIEKIYNLAKKYGAKIII